MPSAKQHALALGFILFITNSFTNAIWANGKPHPQKQTFKSSLNSLPVSDINTPPETNNRVPRNRPTIALALGGGGIRGAAHIGVLRVLLKEGIPIDYIAGCSMGSIVGGMYCAGISLDDIEKVMADKSLQNAFAPGWLSVALIIYPLKKWTCILTFQKRPYAGLFTGKKFRAFLNKRLPKDKEQIENLDIPFVAVVTNLLDGKAYKLAKGDLADCILASSAVPPIMRPVEINGNLYIDGGARSNVPVVSAKQFGADIVIAVSADAILKTEELRRFTSARHTANRVLDIVMAVVDEHHLQMADLAILPDVSDIPLFSKRKKYVAPAIKAGEEAACKALPEIRAAIAKAQAKYPAQTSQTN